jgi:S1-C subfamily serine protease
LGTTASGKPQPGPKPPTGKHQWPGHPTTVVVVVPGGLLKRPGHLVGPLVPVAPGQLIGPVVPAQPVPAAPEITAEPTVAPSFVPPDGGEALPTAAGTSNALRVTERVVDGPAYKSGIQLGDILLKVGERRVKTPDDLQPALAAAKGKIAVVYYSAEAKKVATCEVTPDGDSMGIGVVGITVEIEDEATSSEAQAEGSVTPPPGTETAVQITELIPRGLAARAGLQVGDVILTVNGKRVVAPEQFVALLKEAGGTAEVLFVSPEDGKAEKRTLNGGGGEIGVKVRTVAVASE